MRVSAMRLGMLITSFIALLVGVYIIFNSFTIAVNQRWKEIGILRAVGVERRNINAMFLGEALFMGVIGSCVGIAAGYLPGDRGESSHGLGRGFGLRHRLHRRGAEDARGPGADFVWPGGCGFDCRRLVPGAGCVVSRPHPGAAQHRGAPAGVGAGMGTRIPGRCTADRERAADAVLPLGRRDDVRVLLCGR